MNAAALTLTLGDIDAALRAAFCSVSGRSLGEAEWTAAIKTALASLGHQRKLYVCASGVSLANWGEWLFDITLIRHAHDDDSWFVLNDIIVAAESEWKKETHEILNDFQKLLPVRAQWKVFVCQALPKNVDRIFSRLEKHVCLYSANDVQEQFYIAVYDDSVPAFHVRTGHFADGTFELVPRFRIE